MRYTVPRTVYVCALIAPCFVWADSITIDGVAFHDVYISAGASMYYIQNPADGTTISVARSKISDSDITISGDRVERGKLRDAWKIKRAQRIRDAWKIKRGQRKTGQPLAISSDDWRSQQNASLPALKTKRAAINLDGPVSLKRIRAIQSDDGVLHMSNRTRSARSRGLNARKLFMDSAGSTIMTNRPEQFRGGEYVEVIIPFEQIEVPKSFHRAPTRSRTGPDAGTVHAIVQHYAQRYRLDENLIYAVIKAESNGNRFAVSSAGARGLMQLMPGTARDMGVKDIFDPAENIAGGTQYLSKLASMFKGDMTLALAGYNAGPGNVMKYGGIPPFKETRKYIDRVQRYQRTYERRGIPQSISRRRASL